jgi:hypothetical protein
MTEGLVINSGTYAVNQTDFFIKPETGRWIDRLSVGMDGNGRTIYAPTRQFECRWGNLTPTQFNQLQVWWTTIIATGTVTADLPRYGDTTYNFYRYTGVYVQEPRQGSYFQEYEQDVTLLITNITTHLSS